MKRGYIAASIEIQRSVDLVQTNDHSCGYLEATLKPMYQGVILYVAKFLFQLLIFYHKCLLVGG